MRLPKAAHTSRPWHIHELTPDFRLEDVWLLPTPGGRDAFPLLVSILILCMVVLGGMGNIVGSVVGAAVIVVVPEIIRSVFPGFQQYRYLAFGAVLVAVMIFRPQGLIPSRRRRIELEGPEGPEGLAGLDLGGPEGLEGADALS